MAQKASRGRVEGPAAPVHHAVNPRRLPVSEGGFAWAEPEMVYREAPSTLVASTDVKAALKAGAGPARPPVGAEVDMVRSRVLDACVGAGLAAAFGRLLATRVPKWAFTSPHWYTVALVPA